MSSWLRDHTRQLLIDRPRNITFLDIIEGTGLKRPWLEAFSQDKIPSPSVNKVEILFNYLNGLSIENIITKAAE